MTSSDFRIEQVSFHPVDVGLAETFAVATGKLEQARLVMVRVRLVSGREGWGEMAPFPAITGETRESSLQTAADVPDWLAGQSVLEYRRLFAELKERLPAAAAARCGLETAILDAFSRQLNIPLWAHFGGAAVGHTHVTDITIPVTDLERTVELALSWFARGFFRFKLKVGVDADLELQKIARVRAACPQAQFILDANGGFSLAEARRFLLGLKKHSGMPLLFEQPLAPGDPEGTRALCREFGVTVAADESARSVADVLLLAQSGAAQVINLKIMKSGLREAIQMALVARALGLGLMIGGMLESRLAMGCSFALVLGLGGIEFLDLDTPLLLQSDPWQGGYRYEGSRMLPWQDAGLGMVPAAGQCF
jgi:L-alanine-DL-glutamate epimerase-like enolase superfamily enzyme